MVNLSYLRSQKAKDVQAWYEREMKKKDFLRAEQYTDATVLPLCKFEGDKCGFGRGGVIDSNGIYICDSGIMDRIEGKYDYEKLEIRNEKIVYCGYMVPQWGHFLVEGVSRLWYALRNDKTIDKYVYILGLNEEREIKANYREFLELLGIWDKVEFVNKPTQYREVIIPEHAYAIWNWWSEDFIQIFDAVSKNVVPAEDWKRHEKIFLSRSHLKNIDQKEFNLDMLDDYFKKNGYEVIYPEQHSLSYLICMIRNADVVATNSGSIQHNMLFAQDNKKHIVIERTVVTVDFTVDINRMRNLDVIYIDANLPIYSVSIGYGPFIMFNSKMLQKFTQDYQYVPVDTAYTEKKRMKKIFFKYMKSYRQEYQYQWYMADWEQPFIAAIREGYEEGFEYYKDLIMTEKAFLPHHYFEIRFWKRKGRRMMSALNGILKR